MRTINRILVANRGEIALRVCRTATDMGIATIAVYADQDMAAPHTREADKALSLGGDDAASTYLNGEKILAIALETGADAIHPGYGFLSENSEFARAVADAGQAGHRAIVLGTNRGNKGAQAFYKRHGFRKRSTRTFDVGGVINYDVVMVRDLTTPVE